MHICWFIDLKIRSFGPRCDVFCFCMYSWVIQCCSLPSLAQCNLKVLTLDYLCWDIKHTHKVCKLPSFWFFKSESCSWVFWPELLISNKAEKARSNDKKVKVKQTEMNTEWSAALSVMLLQLIAIKSLCFTNSLWWSTRLSVSLRGQMSAPTHFYRTRN